MDYIKEISTKLDRFCSMKGYQHNTYFEKFLDDILYSFGKPVPKDHIPDNQTGDFLFVITGLYSKAVFNSEPYTDILGGIYMDLASKYKRSGLGQFFTPQSVSDLISNLLLSLDESLLEKQYIHVNDPCIGAGVMMLSYLRFFKNNHPDHFERLAVVMNDLDIICCKMATAQVMSNLLIQNDALASIVTWHGNTLGDPVNWTLFYGRETQAYHDFRMSNNLPVKPPVKIEVNSPFEQLNLF